MGRYKNRIKLKWGTKKYEKRINHQNKYWWYVMTADGWKRITTHLEFWALNQLLREERELKEDVTWLGRRNRR
jgi:hypothetical protein